MELPSNIQIVEESWLARLAAAKLHTRQVALVLGRRIYLWGIEKQDFLQNEKWVRHELAHIAQFKQYGFSRFLLLYGWEWMRRGYYNNRFEVEARAAEEKTN